MLWFLKLWNNHATEPVGIFSNYYFRQKALRSIALSLWVHFMKVYLLDGRPSVPRVTLRNTTGDASTGSVPR